MPLANQRRAEALANHRPLHRPVGAHGQRLVLQLVLQLCALHCARGEQPDLLFDHAHRRPTRPSTQHPV